jgi:hypothetical protein
MRRNFSARWDQSARNLAQPDAMRLLATFSEMLPADRDGQFPKDSHSPQRQARILPIAFLHARLQGNNLGVSSMFSTTRSHREQVEAGQAKTAENGTACITTSGRRSQIAADGQGVTATVKERNQRQHWQENERLVKIRS